MASQLADVPVSSPDRVAASLTPATGPIASRPLVPTPSMPQGVSRRWPLVLLLALAVVAIAVLIGRPFLAPAVADGIINLSGRIEGDQSTIAPRTGGRILEIHVREGDTIQANDLIAVLGDEQLRAREAAAEAALAQAEARAASARDQIAVLQAQLMQTELRTTQSRTDADGRVRQAESELAAAEAQLAQQQALHRLALFDKDAYTRLAKSGAVSERQSLQAVSAADQQASAVAAAERHVDAARAAVATVRANLATPEIRAAETTAVQRQIAQQHAEVSSATAQIAHARAQLAEAQANRQDLTIRAPFAGTIVTRMAEPGEIVSAGMPIVTLVDLGSVYLRGYVPEGRIGLVKAGQSARVYLDSSPDEPVEAVVSRIDPQATFTPENTYFREDRVKQVVGVKLQLKGAIGFAKPGMPADGEILVSDRPWPTSRRSS